MTFEECCCECVSNKELVEQFNRLTGNKLGVRRTPIEITIDKACKYDPDQEAFPAFCAFVLDFVWTPLLLQENKDAKQN